MILIGAEIPYAEVRQLSPELMLLDTSSLV